MSRFFAGPVSLVVAVAAMGSLGWYMSTQAPPGYVPHHLQAAATPGPAKVPVARTFHRSPPVRTATAAVVVTN